MMRLIVSGIVLDVLALVFFLALFCYARVMLPLDASRHVTALDRAGVFCEDKLRAYNSALAENVRHKLGPFIAQDYNRAIQLVVVVALGLTAVRLVLLALLRHKCAEGMAGPVQGQAKGARGEPRAR